MLGPLRILSESVTWHSTFIFLTSSMAFLNAIAYYVTIGEGVLDSIIQRYTLNTNSVGVRLSGPIKSLITLKAICSAISLLIPGISEAII